jgi:hypothetical protein
METAPARRGSHFFLFLLLGVVLGVAGTSVVHYWLGPSLFSRFQDGSLIEGQVLDKAPEADRLLLKVETEHGVLLATFTQRQEAIALLVDRGDTITLGVREYQPFLEDPAIARVRRPKPPIESEEPSVESGIEEEPPGTAAEAIEPPTEPSEPETSDEPEAETAPRN